MPRTPSSRSLPMMQAPPSALEPVTVSLSLEIGEELIFVPVGDKLPLSHSLLVGETQIPGTASVIFRRGEQYWLEPGNEEGNVLLLNEQLIQTPQKLNNGDNIMLGSVRMTFLVPRT